MKLFFSRNTIFILNPLKLISFKSDYNHFHTILHQHQTKTSTQSLFLKPASILDFIEDPKLKAMIYIAIKKHNKKKHVPEYITNLQSKNTDLNIIIKLLNNDIDTLSDLKVNDFLGYIIFLMNKHVVKYYKQIKTDILYLKNETKTNPFISHNEVVKAIDNYLVNSNDNDLININRQMLIHKSFCLSNKDDTISSFCEQYQNMLDMIFNDNPVEECMIDEDGYWEVKLYNELVGYLKGNKKIDKELLKMKHYTLNQRGIRQYVIKKSKSSFE